MPRVPKCRRVCFEPHNRVFTPGRASSEVVLLTVEECEAVRLVDREGLDQDPAADSMGISRGTLQRILYSARYKLADAISDGKGIVIKGGNYELAKKRCNCDKPCSTCRFNHIDKGDIQTDE